MIDFLQRFMRVLVAVLFFSVIGFIIIYAIMDWVGNKQAEKRHFQELLGTYVLDLRQTKLGVYSKDSSKYKGLHITFKADSTFYLNMQVPFIYDSLGRWNAAGNGLEDWNWLYYKSWDYTKYEKNTGNQFGSPWTKDSTFDLNATTPKKGEKALQKIYFKKEK